uniref:Uncharacterized protein n=1 Tax=Pyricularia grisea TaxID=148305 RepID=Q8J182_PYRGI|nr:hypothetical protein [Pyricularia grisea]
MGPVFSLLWTTQFFANARQSTSLPPFLLFKNLLLAATETSTIERAHNESPSYIRHPYRPCGLLSSSQCLERLHHPTL